MDKEYWSEQFEATRGFKTPGEFFAVVAWYVLMLAMPTIGIVFLVLAMTGHY